MVVPDRLRPGDRVALIAPSGPHIDAELPLIDRAAELLESWQLSVSRQPTYRSDHPYLAGTDDYRAACFAEAYTDPAIKGIFCTRGGYGASRLCARLDDSQIRGHCKIVVGYSDVSALLFYVHRVSGIVVYHGPNIATQGVLDADSGKVTRVWLRAALFDVCASGFALTTVRPGTAKGPLIGGNLTVFTHSIGTRDEPDTEGRILFLEDRDRSPHQVDRMITHLRGAGKLDRVAGVVFGDTLCRTAGDTNQVLAGLFKGAGYPVAAGLPSGHGVDCFPLPIGADAEMVSAADVGTTFSIR